MADNLGLDIDALSKKLRGQAQGIRRLASGILDGEFRRGLEKLARDYDVQAAMLVERKKSDI